MGKFSDIFKISRKTFFNPSAWLSLDSLKTNTGVVKNILQDAFKIPQATTEETFEEALKRFGLNEDDLKHIDENYLMFAYFFLALSVICFLFAFYLLFMHYSISGWLLALVSSALFAGQAFRYHFWHFQIKHRKLGCTIKEWRQGRTDEEMPA